MLIDDAIHYFFSVCYFSPRSGQDFCKQEIRSMARVSAQCCCIPYTVIEIFDCNCNDLELRRLRSFRVKGHGANRKPIGGFLSDLHGLQRRISHRIGDI